MFHCASETTGPIWALPLGSPTVVASAAAFAMATTSAIFDFGASIRVGALQDWPVLVITERTPPVTAVFMSASSRMMFGLLPPSS